jgi:AcrR family transcriptional regulator
MGRTEQLLTAAVEVVADGGMRGLTHRAVDARAGLPQGSTSNVFRSRQALVAGILEHLLTSEAAEMATLPPPTTRDEFLDNVVRMTEYLLGPGLRFTKARYAIFLEAVSHPGLRDEVTAAAARLVDALAEVVGVVVPSDPGEVRTRAALVLEALDAVLLGRVARPLPVADTLAVRVLVGAALDADLG